MTPGEVRNQWFGPAVNAPVCQILEHVPPPVGSPCLFCEQPIATNDCGLIVSYLGPGHATRRPTHYLCLMTAIGVEETDLIGCQSTRVN